MGYGLGILLLAAGLILALAVDAEISGVDIQLVGWILAALGAIVLVLTAVIMTGRTVVALLADSTFLYFLQPIISDGVVATAFLLSLATARPLVARLAGDFYPMDHELHLRPRVQTLFRHLTIGWALLCLCKAGAALVLLLSLEVETFLLVRDASLLTLNVLAVGATITLAVRVARHEGLLCPAATA